jgi:hypothetical protein
MSLMPAVFPVGEAAAGREGFRGGTLEELWSRLEFFMAKAPDFQYLMGGERQHHPIILPTQESLDCESSNRFNDSPVTYTGR